MITQEFSSEFDILYNNIMSNQAPGLDEYEKSVFLTKAQEEIIIELYSGRNPFNNSFEKTEEIKRYLSDLVKTYITYDKKDGYVGLSETSVFFELPKDLWFITYESVSLEDDRLGCMNGKEILVVPVTQDDYFKISENPFKGANKRRALRLDVSNEIVEIVSEYNVNKYLIRYLSRPDPIILVDLQDDLSINEVSVKTECKLNDVLHRAILEKAVQLAHISWNSDLSK